MEIDPFFFYVCLIASAGLNSGLLIQALRWMRRHPAGADCRPGLQTLLHLSTFTGGCFLALVTALILSGEPQRQGGPSLVWLVFFLTSAPALAMHPRLAGKANVAALLAMTALIHVLLYAAGLIWIILSI